MDFKHQGEAAVASAVENLDKDTPSSAGFSVAVAVQSGDLVTSMFLVFSTPPKNITSKFRDLLKPHIFSNQLPIFLRKFVDFHISTSVHFSPFFHDVCLLNRNGSGPPWPVFWASRMMAAPSSFRALLHGRKRSAAVQSLSAKKLTSCNGANGVGMIGDGGDGGDS